MEKYQRIFFELLENSIADNFLRVVVAGQTHDFGSPDSARHSVALTVHNRKLFKRVLADGNLGLAEAYMDGWYEVSEGKIYDLLIILLHANLAEKVRSKTSYLWNLGWLRLRQLYRGKYHNVQSHYDIGDDLFETFLDSRLTYTCGYQKTDADDLEELQTNKFDRICQKLRLQENELLLDIGCGYGALLIHAAKNFGVKGVGLTISKHHCETARRKVQEAGLSDRITIEFASHQEIEGEFDKVVSVGMMEHLTRPEYREYILNIGRVLKPQGIGLIHTIGCNTSKNHHDPFIQKYIFPGSAQPKLSEITGELEREELAILDVENMIRHYAQTGLQWHDRFTKNYDSLDQQKYDSRFYRMWEYYLSCVVAGGAASPSALYQVLFARTSQIDMPFQRV